MGDTEMRSMLSLFGDDTTYQSEAIEPAITPRTVPPGNAGAPVSLPTGHPIIS
jgi:hypothetical protein